MKETAMMFSYGNGMNGWGYALMIISMLAFWGLLIAGVVYLVRQPGSPGPKDIAASVTRTPEQFLAARFARGEIDAQEYNDRAAVLHGKVLS